VISLRDDVALNADERWSAILAPFYKRLTASGEGAPIRRDPKQLSRAAIDRLARLLHRCST